MTEPSPRGGVLFLYTIASGYLLACLGRYARATGQTARVVTLPMVPEAPYELEAPDGVELVDRGSEGAREALRGEPLPRVVYVSGWRDVAYLRAAHRFRARGVPTILGLDNWWRGTPRQWGMALAGGAILRSCFSHLWIPGSPQLEYARRLGFPRERTLTGVYCADGERFEAARSGRRGSWPHRLLFVGRLAAIKGLPELLRAFEEVGREAPNDWELVIAGAGGLADRIPRGGRVTFRGFVQPRELPALAAGAGAFVLPSRVEPWGVALHEAALAGLPLVASRAVGAASEFLREGENGFLHEPGDAASLQDALARLFRLGDDALGRMGARSAELARRITLDSWAATLGSVAEAGTGGEGS